mmetsp:Transcript_13313/g.20284  ORF Transcript_13313/g.20284 Transcript_13313/m.20284 type:complete len:81 (-) Transcript_13313:64-306(-)
MFQLQKEVLLSALSSFPDSFASLSWHAIPKKKVFKLNKQKLVWQADYRHNIEHNSEISKLHVAFLLSCTQINLPSLKVNE